MVTPPLTLSTERLLLRPLTDDDRGALLRYRSQPDVCRYVPFEPMDETEIDRRLREQWSKTDLDRPGTSRTLGVVGKGTGRLVGDVVLMRDLNERGTAEIGYVFDPAVSGRGFATEAARALIELAFADLDLHRVIGRIDSRNTASARVLERIGMRREADFIGDSWFKGEWTSTTVFAILQGEWRDARETPPTY